MYRYGYQFAKSALETPGQKSIDKQMAKDMLTVLLRSRWPLLPAFQTFLDVSVHCHGVTRAALTPMRHRTTPLRSSIETSGCPSSSFPSHIRQTSAATTRTAHVSRGSPLHACCICLTGLGALGPVLIDEFVEEQQAEAN